MNALTATTQQTNKVTTLLKWTYVIVPIVAGLDKYVNILVEWHIYLAPVVADILPFDPHTFMYIVGVIEVIAGILVLVKPKIGGLVVSLWLLAIAINLIFAGYYDIAVRDISMAVGAYSLHLLTKE